MATSTDLRRIADANRQIVRLAQRDLRRLWSTLERSNSIVIRDTLDELLPDLVTSYGDLAATVAADWYDDLRAQAGVSGPFTPILAGAVATDAVRRNIRHSLTPMFQADRDAAAALGLLAAETERMVLQSGRDTITRSAGRDPKAAGWSRITRSPDPCKLCVSLASRGAVYKQATVRFAAHTNCNCGAVPSWNQNAPEVPVEAYQASARTSSMNDAELRRHRARTRDWITTTAPNARG